MTFEELNVKAGDGLIPENWHNHPNGKGWVQNTATVAETAFVGPDASVYEYAQVLDCAEIYGDAEVFGEAKISGNAEIFGDTWVRGNAEVGGDVEICDGEIGDNARIFGNKRD